MILTTKGGVKKKSQAIFVNEYRHILTNYIQQCVNKTATTSRHMEYLLNLSHWRDQRREVHEYHLVQFSHSIF